MASQFQGSDGTPLASNEPAVRLPENEVQAIKKIHERLTTLRNQKRLNSEAKRDIFTAAKAKGITVKRLRQAVRLNRMSPEQREAWAADMSEAAKLFGFTGLGVADDCGDHPMRGFIASIEMLDEERAELVEDEKAWKGAAKDRGIDLKAMGFFVSKSHMDRVELGEYFTGLENMGAALSFW